MQTAKMWAPLMGMVIVLALALVAGPYVAHEISYAAAKGQIDASRQELSELSKNDTTSRLFVEVAKVLKPAVVEVRVTKKMKMATPDMDEFFRRFFGDDNPFGPRTTPGTPSAPQPREREYFARGLGSGVIVDAKNGYVLTNYHVVGGADEVQVVLEDGRTLKAQWVRTDPQTDLAIVKVAADNLIDAPLGDSDKMEVGDLVLAIGSPEGLQQTVTAGIISAKGRTTGEPNSYQSFIQTDAAINHGNSGGPLVNTRGEVIGINSAIVSRTGVNEGIGFAIPSNMARNVMDQLIAKGKVTRGFLGVVIQNVDENLARSFKLPDTKGALVASVSPDGPADKAKIKVEDFIVAVDGRKVAGVNELRNVVASLEPGKTYKLDLYRDGKKQAIEVKLDNQPADMSAAASSETKPEQSGSKFGLTVSDVSDQKAQQLGYKTTPKGVLITDVTSGSSAEEQGLKPGMVITAVGGKEITTPDEFANALSGKEAAEGVRIRVMDASGAGRFVFLTPGK